MKIIFFSISLFLASITLGFSINNKSSNHNDFGFSLLRELSADKNQNLFFSPYSIRTILSLVAEGAKGKTETEMLEVLTLETDKEKRRQEFKELIKALNANQDFKLNTTNTLWIDKSLELLDLYSKMALEYYLSESRTVDYEKNHKQVRITINKYVESKTKGLIKDLIPEGAINETTKLVLTNTIYFKAEWQTIFNKERTQKEDFHISPKEKKTVDMMKMNEKMLGGKVGKTSIIELPYKGGEISMWAMLPDEDNTQRLVKELNADEFQKFKKGVKYQSVVLSFPKFDFESSFGLAETLKKMGMATAFQDDADFSGISQKTGLKISEVIHKAKVIVEEKTTEAAAATAVVMVATSSSMEPKLDLPFVFNANKPFVFVIEHKKSGHILFTGIVNKP
jgi:serpin B